MMEVPATIETETGIVLHIKSYYNGKLFISNSPTISFYHIANEQFIAHETNKAFGVTAANPQYFKDWEKEYLKDK